MLRITANYVCCAHCCMRGCGTSHARSSPLSSCALCSRGIIASEQRKITAAVHLPNPLLVARTPLLCLPFRTDFYGKTIVSTLNDDESSSAAKLGFLRIPRALAYLAHNIYIYLYVRRRRFRDIQDHSPGIIAVCVCVAVVT